jgi:hypothetical protein
MPMPGDHIGMAAHREHVMAAQMHAVTAYDETQNVELTIPAELRALGIRPNGREYTMPIPDVKRFFSNVELWPHKFQAALLINGDCIFSNATLSINR